MYLCSQDRLSTLLAYLQKAEMAPWSHFADAEITRLTSMPRALSLALRAAFSRHPPCAVASHWVHRQCRRL